MDHPVRSGAVYNLEVVNKELWLVLSMFVIALLLNVLVDAQRMLLCLYTLPTVGSAYFYGRRHATLTALASVLLIALLAVTVPQFASRLAGSGPSDLLLDLMAWGGTLVLTGYLMGTLYEHKNAQLRELRETYKGVLMLLRHFISKDEYTEHHSHR